MLSQDRTNDILMVELPGTAPGSSARFSSFQ